MRGARGGDPARGARVLPCETSSGLQRMQSPLRRLRSRRTSQWGRFSVTHFLLQPACIVRLGDGYLFSFSKNEKMRKGTVPESHAHNQGIIKSTLGGELIRSASRFPDSLLSLLSSILTDKIRSARFRYIAPSSSYTTVGGPVGGIG